MFFVSYLSPCLSVRQMSDVGHCDVLFSSLDRYIGSVCIASSSSVGNGVLLSAMTIILKQLRAFLQQFFKKILFRLIKLVLEVESKMNETHFGLGRGKG